MIFVFEVLNNMEVFEEINDDASSKAYHDIFFKEADRLLNEAKQISLYPLESNNSKDTNSKTLIPEYPYKKVGNVVGQQDNIISKKHHKYLISDLLVTLFKDTSYNTVQDNIVIIKSKFRKFKKLNIPNEIKDTSNIDCFLSEEYYKKRILFIVENDTPKKNYVNISDKNITREILDFEKRDCGEIYSIIFASPLSESICNFGKILTASFYAVIIDRINLKKVFVTYRLSRSSNFFINICFEIRRVLAKNKEVDLESLRRENMKKNETKQIVPWLVVNEDKFMTTPEHDVNMSSIDLTNLKNIYVEFTGEYYYHVYYSVDDVVQNEKYME